MATALKVVPAPPAAPACSHHAFNRYEAIGGYPDDVVTERGRCPTCNQWLEIVSYCSMDYSEESLLDQATITRLRAEVLADFEASAL